MKDKYLITFAGAVGCSKTPIAHYLSCKLGLPIYSNDCIRSEIHEDFDEFNKEEFLKRRTERLEEMIERGQSFIYDASNDRGWDSYRKQVEESGYKFFIISLDLTRELLEKMSQRKRYFESLQHLDKFVEDHDRFLKEYEKDIGLHITDKEFPDRLELSYKKVSDWLKNN